MRKVPGYQGCIAVVGALMLALFLFSSEHRNRSADVKRARVLVVVVGAAVVFVIGRSRQSLREAQEAQRSAETSLQKEATERVDAQLAAIRAIIKEKFLVYACPACQETAMRLIEFSPSGRSVHYQCLHCSKKMRAPAGAPAAEEAPSAVSKFSALIEEYLRVVPENPWTGQTVTWEIHFETVASPLPYEETTREPIPAEVRGEVWRRDLGKCVSCGSNQNLQFDHIIPVTLGGATSARNLQLLCRQCNLGKSARI